MSIECPSSPSYRTSAQQKLEAQNAAKMYRYGSPKLRDVLREKCRIRMRRARQSSFEQSRDLQGDKALPLNEILRQELAELEEDIELQENIYKELVVEVNEWFANQLEEEESYIINTAESNEVFCAVCKKHALECSAPGEYKCACGASFHFAGDIQHLRSMLQLRIEQHEQSSRQCTHNLTFFVGPFATGNANALNAVCFGCEYMCSF